LIGPVPPALGGATPGGVATHQVYLAAGLAAAGVDAPLLATNVRHGRVDPHPPERRGRGDPHPPERGGPGGPAPPPPTPPHLGGRRLGARGESVLPNLRERGLRLGGE